MLINKWLVTDTVNLSAPHADNTGICLYIPTALFNVETLYHAAHSLPPGAIVTILLNGEENYSSNNSLVNNLLGFFFQPSYRIINNRPLVFLQNKTQDTANFLAMLNEKCRAQGFADIMIGDIAAHPAVLPATFNYLVKDSDINLSALLENWVLENSNGKQPGEINFLFPQTHIKLIPAFAEAETSIKNADIYHLAKLLYDQRLQLDDVKHALHLKSAAERNLQSYLDAQKLEREKQVEWYHYEYDILPKWYKQFGHLIKVLMGKRSFKSLFNDNVKKYKD